MRKLFFFSFLHAFHFFTRHVTCRLNNSSKNDLSLFLTKKCPDGSIGIGDACLCSEESKHRSCQLGHLRNFLPPRTEFDRYLTRSRRIKDSSFGRSLASYILRKSLPRRVQGYPTNLNCSAMKCHEPSIGKYIRYNAHLTYSIFKRSALISDGKARNSDNVLFDLPIISYPSPPGFRWARSVPDCYMLFSEASWNCGFANIFQPPMRELSASSDDDIFELAINGIRAKNHIWQLFIFGKVLDMNSLPSMSVKTFVSRHVVHIPASGFRHNEHTRAAPKVSMHVRQGDSCDFVIGAEMANMSSYLRWDRNNSRPCFAIDVYIKKLRYLQTLYGVNTVYLATDSHEMILRAYNEKSINWIFLNISRESFNRGHWVDFRADEDNEVAFYSAVGDFELLKRGDIFLGTFTSIFGSSIYYKMLGYHMRLIPFMSLDYPLSF